MVLKAASVIGVTTLEIRPCLPAWSKGNLAPSLPMIKEHLSTINSAAPLVINRNSPSGVRKQLLIRFFSELNGHT